MKMKSTTLISVAVAMQLACASIATAATTVRWAEFAATPSGLLAPNIIGAPDARFFSSEWQAAKFNIRVDYATLAATMGLTEAELGTYDVLTWEGNGGGSAASGGWESANFAFTGGGNVSATFNELTGASSNPAVVFKTGSVNAAQYAGLFGASDPLNNVYSWLLVRLPAGVDAHSPSFAVDFRGVGGGVGLGEGTPDPDAIGVLSLVPEPGLLAMMVTGLAMLGVCRRRRWMHPRTV